VKKLIAERASATGDAADAYCEVWEVCHGARSGPATPSVGREVRVASRRRDTNLVLLDDIGGFHLLEAA
jgi:hypothetical protein